MIQHLSVTVIYGPKIKDVELAVRQHQRVERSGKFPKKLHRISVGKYRGKYAVFLAEKGGKAA